MPTMFAILAFAFFAAIGIFIAWDIRRITKHETATGYLYQNPHLTNTTGMSGVGFVSDSCGGGCADGGSGSC